MCVFVARKKGQQCTARLYSREGAAELRRNLTSLLANYELGNTKVVPVDKVVLMADSIMHRAENWVLQHECPCRLLFRLQRWMGRDPLFSDCIWRIKRVIMTALMNKVENQN